MKALVLAALVGLVLLLSSCSSDDEQPEATTSAIGPCRIAFRVRAADYADAPSDIHVVDPDGTGQKNLTGRWSVYEWSPVWSPDGRKIAFTAQGSDLGATDIFVMNADGSGRRRLTHAGPYSEMGTWSRDGRTIFFTQLEASGEVTAWAMNADGSAKRRIRGFADAFVSPNGDHVVGTRNSGVESDYYGSPDVYVVKSNGDDGRWLTRTGDTEVFGWSPDGEWILYKRLPGVYVRGAPGLYAVRPDGTDRTRLVDHDEIYDASWSPDGELVLYASQSAPVGIHLVALDGQPPRRLTRRVNHLSPSWSREGQRILFQRSLGEIWLMNRDGSGIRPLLQPRGPELYEAPAWSPACP